MRKRETRERNQGEEEDEMPSYEFYCPACKKEVVLTLTIREREAGGIKCPQCGGTDLQPLMGTFFSKTSRKS